MKIIILLLMVMCVMGCAAIRPGPIRRVWKADDIKDVVGGIDEDVKKIVSVIQEPANVIVENGRVIVGGRTEVKYETAVAVTQDVVEAPVKPVRWWTSIFNRLAGLSVTGIIIFLVLFLFFPSVVGGFMVARFIAIRRAFFEVVAGVQAARKNPIKNINTLDKCLSEKICYKSKLEIQKAKMNMKI